MTNSALLFRTATPSDLEALATLVNSAYRGDSSRAGWTTEADLLDGQRTDAESLAQILNPAPLKQTLLVAVEPQEKIVGCVHLKQESSREAYLGLLTIRPSQQNSGLGRSLLEAAENFVRKTWQAQSLRMTVITLRPELIQWYERRGFQKTGELEKFPYGDPRFGLPKRPDLEFCVLRKNL